MCRLGPNLIRGIVRHAIVLALLGIGGCRSDTGKVHDFSSNSILSPDSILGLIPSNDRDWQPSVSAVPRAQIGDSEVKLENVRNCRYVTENDYVVNYESRTVNLDQLKTVDFIVAPFKQAPSLAHTMLSFGFDDGQYVVVSVEARLEKGESYSPIRGALWQYELIYLVGDERDLVQLRSNHRQSDVYIYPARVTPEKVRTLFVDMLTRANKLADSPEFYDTLTNNCTTNIVYHVNKIEPGLIPRDLRVLLPGNSDHLAFELGLIDKSKSFDEIRRRAYINDRAIRYASAPNFSQRIRR